MAAPTVIGTNTWALRLSDVATDATDPGVWAWYFSGNVTPETWDATPIVDMETGDDNSLAVMFGQFRWTMVVQDCLTVKTKADFDKIKRAFRYWNDNNTLLYLQSELGTVDNAYWSNATWAAATDKIRVRIIKIVWKSQMVDQYNFSIYLKRYTT